MAKHQGVDTHLNAAITFFGVWDTVGALGIPGHLFAAMNSRLHGFYDTGACWIRGVDAVTPQAGTA